MSDLEKGPSDLSRAIKRILEPVSSKKIIVLATSTINSDSLFANGLYQNVYVLYKLFDAIGYAPILLINDMPKDINEVPSFMRNIRMITGDEICKLSIPIYLHVEIAMSIDADARRYMRSKGTKMVKLYLGNILNIDIETPIFYPGVTFSHHVIGELDEIWVSPHYKQHYEYAGLINQGGPAKIAPYVWDPSILTLGGTRSFKWKPKAVEDTQVFVVLEPNISFQKCALIPLLIVETLYRKTKMNCKILLGNSERFQANPFFTKTILPTLELYKDNKIIFSGRNTITSIMNNYPSAIAISHQLNNQYNYMTLEYLFSGFPIIHNSPDWSDAGYYYEGSNIENGANVLEKVLLYHSSNIEQYMSGSAVLQWRHSIYNPEVQNAWTDLINCGLNTSF
jgi:hypothetical protein